MWKNLLHRLIGPVSHAWIVSRLTRFGPLPVPNDLPIVHGSGPDPDRIFLIGGRMVRGIGVASYDLGLAGMLARQLAARTGRGADVEARGLIGFDVAMAIDELRKTRLDRFCAVVILVGMKEVVSWRPTRMWRHDVRRLLTEIAELTPRTLPVLLVAVPPFASVLDLPQFIKTRLNRKLTNMNIESERACGESGAAEYVPFDPVVAAHPYMADATGIYASWAAALVPPLACALDEAPERDVSLAPPVDEEDRQRALDELGVVGTNSDVDVDHIVQMARRVLVVSGASVTLLDHDRQLMKAAAGMKAADSPRSASFCDTTIKQPGPFIVEDVELAPEFQNASWVTGPERARFYAGYPLEAPGGQRVGALCVVDRQPRHFGPDEIAILRELALRAQRILWEQAN